MLRHVLKAISYIQRRRYAYSCNEFHHMEKFEERKFSSIDKVNVTILNANSPLGEATSLILKNDQLVKDLNIHCKSGTPGIMRDLLGIPTSTNVQAYVGSGQLNHALSKADIVLIMGKHEPDDVSSTKDMFFKNLDYTKFMAEACVEFCPNAIIIVDIYPITTTLPYIAEFLAENGVFAANKLLGSVAIHSLRSQSVVGKILGISPNKVCVDVIGGGTPETMIPVISSSYPGGPALTCVDDKIRDKIKRINSEVFAATCAPAVLSKAYSLAGFVHKVSEGLTGRPNVRANAFIRTSALMGVDFFTMPIGLGVSGLETNYGIPKLSDSELKLMDEVLPVIQSEVQLGVRFARPALSKNSEDAENQYSTHNVIIPEMPCDF